jgi:NAD(P)-dependent dehydrogenase (short-subunit alcohol dehydrogenase family)
MSAFDLSGRRAVVVGGTSGIGRTLALGLADAGADVVATGRRASLVDEVAAEIEKRGRRTLRMPADVGDAASLERLRDGMLETLGGLDILVCAAGTTKKVPTLDMEETTGRGSSTRTTPARCARVRSLAVRWSRGGRAASSRSRRSLIPQDVRGGRVCGEQVSIAGLTVAGCGVAPSGVAVNAILPGVFRTDLNRAARSPRGQEFLMRTPMRRFREDRRAGRCGGVLASDASSFVTGHLLAVDGGFLASGVNQ